MLPFTCKDLFIAFIPLMHYGESISADMSLLIIHFGTPRQRHRLFCSMNKMIIKQLLRMDDMDPNYRNGRPLRIAVKSDRIDIVDMLLRDSRVDINAKDGEALILAIRNDNRQMINLLFDHGAEVIGEGAILAAIAVGSTSIVSAIIDDSPTRVTILCAAIRAGNYRIVKIIMGHKKYKKLTQSLIVVEELFMQKGKDAAKITRLVFPKVYQALSRVPSYFWKKFTKNPPYGVSAIREDVIIAMNETLINKSTPWPLNIVDKLLRYRVGCPSLACVFENVCLEETDNITDMVRDACTEVAEALVMSNTDLWYFPGTAREFRTITLEHILSRACHSWTAPMIYIYLSYIFDNLSDTEMGRLRHIIVDWVPLLIIAMSTRDNESDEVEKIVRILYDYMSDYAVEEAMISAIRNCNFGAINFIVNDKAAWKMGDGSISALRWGWQETKSLSFKALVRYVYMNKMKPPAWVREAMMLF